MIADIDYYTRMGFIRGANSADLPKALQRAERVIDLVTVGKCRQFDDLHEEARERLRFAICAQAESFIRNGFGDDTDSVDHKVKIGDFSYESRNNGVSNLLCPTAMATLKLSGLLYAGLEAV